MMLRIKCIPETFSAEIECVTIQTELSKRRPGVVSQLFFFILEPMRIFYGLRITLTIEKSRHRVKSEIALLTKLPGAFNKVTTERDRGVGMIGCWYSKAEAEFFFHQFPCYNCVAFPFHRSLFAIKTFNLSQSCFSER